MTNIQTHSTQTTGYQIRQETYRGKQYMIVPVVMMVEGVHSGSRGALLHTTQELSQSVNNWENIPVVIDHPERNGQFISAHEDGVHRIGIVRNARMEGEKLKAEAWLDVMRLQAESPVASQYIQEQRPLEVSIGVFTTDEEIEGQWKGEAYIAIARNHQPDHLALLPEDQGACSWADGCGIRLNKETSKQDATQAEQTATNRNENETTMNTAEINAMSKLIESGFDLQINDQGYQQLMQQMQQKLDGMDNDMRTYYLQEVYDNHVIYNVRNRDGGESKLYKQTYSVDANKQVELTGDPVEVRQEVSYVTVNEKPKRIRKTKLNEEQSINNNEKEVTNMTKTKETPCTNKQAKVDELINCELTNFSEGQREWLMEQDEKTLDLFKVKLPTQPAPEVNAEDGKDKVITKQEAMQTLKEGIKTTDDFLNLVPTEMKDSMQSALRLHQSYRTKLIDSIVTNSDGVWNKEDLETESTEKLEKVAKPYMTDNKDVDYSANGGTYETPTTNQEHLLPYGVDETK